MRLRGPLFLLALFVAPVASLVSVAAAWGDDASVASSPTDAGATRHDPDDRTALAEWMERCVQGNKKFLAKDVPGAIDLPNGEATLKFALDLSDDRDPNVRGKLLFLNADVKEREKKWDEAKAAWQSYADYSARHADAGMAPTTPPARVQSIDDMIKQDKAYEVVRQRIVEVLRDAGPAPVDASKKK
jgi:hypothetical protein